MNIIAARPQLIWDQIRAKIARITSIPDLFRKSSFVLTENIIYFKANLLI